MIEFMVTENEESGMIQVAVMAEGVTMLAAMTDIFDRLFALFEEIEMMKEEPKAAGKAN